MSETNESLFRALADGQRRKVLHLLRNQEASAGELVEQMDITSATLSHHLAILKQAGLVRVRKEGQKRIYALNTSMVEEALLFLTTIMGEKKSS